MDDGDLAGNIDDRIDQFEDQKGGPKRFENDTSGRISTKWWFASSASPMIAGTLGPVASAFSICALARPWRQHVPPGASVTQGTFVPDPDWLVAVNAVQLAVAVVANMFLLLNMARRVRFSVAQPITVVGWYISAVCLMVLLATAAGPLRLYPRSQYVWSQAFYYGLFSAILYFIVASLMVVTIWGAHTGHYSKDFQLTNSQRTLMLQTIMYLFYLLVGALVFSNIENWIYLDGVYWANVTLFTVGYGDYTPSTHLGRALVIPYSLIGIITLGLLIGSIRSMVLERGSRRLDARMIEKTRRRLIDSMYRSGNDAILQPIYDGRMPEHPAASNAVAQAVKEGKFPVPRTEYERRRAEFLLMRRIQKQASHRRRWVSVLVSFGVWVTLWVVGAAIFQQSEMRWQHWTYFEAFYFSFITLATIGYGDLDVVSPAGKAFFVLWSLLALPTTTVLISNSGDTIVLAVKNLTIDLGNVTILPGERGFKKDTEIILHKLSFGLLFPKKGLQQEEEEEEERKQLNRNGEDEDGDDGGDVVTLPPGFFAAAHSTGHVNESHSRGHSSSSTRNHGDDDDDDDSRASSDMGGRYHHSIHRPTTGEPILRSATSEQQDPTPYMFRQNPSSAQENGSYFYQNGDARGRRPSLSKIRDPTAPLTMSKADFHCLLVSEIAAVTHDMHRSDPKQYTFSEWAWYLKLIGEDESNPATHIRARPHVKKKQLISCSTTSRANRGQDQTQSSQANGQPNGNATQHSATRRFRPQRNRTTNAGSAHPSQRSSLQIDSDAEGNGEGNQEEGDNRGDMDVYVAEGDKWSWVGSRSPLMGSQEESEWILNKLTDKLRHELEMAREK